jgi:CheY-like chemotaxis protein
VHDIRVAAERAASLNASLLAYVGQAPGALESVDLHACARETVAMLRPLVDPAVRLELTASPDPTYVHADPGQLTQVIMNLINNAAEAVAQGGGLVCIETGVGEYPAAAGRAWLPEAPKSGRYAFFRVSDDGPGVPAGIIERIFDPFFSTKATGRGLGLSATLGIVKRHHGALGIHSQLGIGTCFDVVLPVAERQSTRPPPSSRAPSASFANTGVVLFCDDETLIRQLAKRILEREGYEVTLAASGEEALELLSTDTERFSVLVVDHSLPGLRGDKVALRARELKPDLAIVRASGYRDIFDDKEVSGSVFLPKPFTREALLDSLIAAGRAKRR